MPTFVRLLFNIAALLLFIQILPSLVDGVKATYGHFASPKSRVGVVVMNHMLVNSSSYVNSFKTFFKDKNIKAILIQMDCPGGISGTSQAIFEEIKLLKKEYPKPVVTFVEKVCASGGYHVAVASDAIVATSSAFIGSIGVYIVQPYVKDFIEQFKLQCSFVKSGKFKTVGNPLVEQTEERRALLQGLTDDTYQQFMADVVSGRPQLVMAKSSEWAEGRVFTGRQALALGLIDATGSISTATKLIKQKAHITGEIAWVMPPSQNFLERLLGRQDENSLQLSELGHVEQYLQAAYQALVRQGTELQS